VTAARYRSARGITTVLVVFFCLVILVNLVAVAIEIQRIDLLLEITSGSSGRGYSQPQALNEALERLESTNLPFWIATSVWWCIATAVIFSIWIYRVCKNLEPLGSRNRKYTPAFAVVSCFIPLVNWVLPFLVAREIWKASDPKSMDGDSWHNARVSLILPAWWGLFVLSSLSQFFIMSAIGHETWTRLQYEAWAWLISDVLETFAAVLAILVVWCIASMQDEKNRNLVSAAPAAVRYA